MRPVGHSAARLVGATKIYNTGDDQVRALDGVDVEFASSDAGTTVTATVSDRQGPGIKLNSAKFGG